jgi:hypothetical protein
VTEHINRGPADDEDPEAVGKGLGGVTGAAAGAGLGAMLGPAGVVIGGIAGALGGWWAGRGVGKATDQFGDETDEHYRRLHEQQFAGHCDYDDARCFYQLGHVARSNPDYEGRPFAEVENDLRRGWRDDAATDRFRSWDDVRPYVSTGYEKRPGD